MSISYSLLFLIFTFLFICAAPEAQAALIVQAPKYTGLTSGLVGYWPFDGKSVSGTSAADLSGNGNHGTLTNGPKITEGKIGQALNFDGVNDYVSVFNPTSFNFGTADFTITTWVKETDLTQSVNIFSKTADGAWAAKGKQFIIPNDGGGNNHKLCFDAFGVGTTCSNTLIADTNWYFVAATFSDAPNFLQLYIDGVPDVSATLALTADDATHVIKIGSIAGSFTTATIDDVRIYNRALTPDEIKRLYNLGR